MTQSTSELIAERHVTHGLFKSNAYCAQDLKRTLKEHLHLRAQAGRATLPDEQVEALDLIFTKIARIVAGDNLYEGHWADIAGYAKLGERVGAAISPGEKGTPTTAAGIPNRVVYPQTGE